MPCERCGLETCFCGLNDAFAGMNQAMAGLGQSIQNFTTSMGRVVEAFQRALAEAFQQAFPAATLAELTGTLPETRYGWLAAPYDLPGMAEEWNRLEAPGVEMVVDAKFEQMRDAILRRATELPQGRDIMTAYRTHADPRLNPDTHCELCCLPRVHHIDHKPPGPTPEYKPGDPEFQAFMKVRNGYYSHALGKLSDQMLLDMPLPASPWRLYLMGQEVTNRLKSFQEELEERRRTFHTRYAVLMDDDA